MNIALWWSKAKYWVLLTLAIVIGVLLAFLQIRAGEREVEAHRVPPSPLRAAAEKAHEQALVEEVKAKTINEEHMAHLDAIQKVDDGVERRRQLAEFAKSL